MIHKKKDHNQKEKEQIDLKIAYQMGTFTPSVAKPAENDSNIDIKVEEPRQ